MKALLHRYFSLQDGVIKHLYERWRDFKFHPHTDDIKEVFISDVKQTGHQINHNEIAVLI